MQQVCSDGDGGTGRGLGRALGEDAGVGEGDVSEEAAVVGAVAGFGLECGSTSDP